MLRFNLLALVMLSVLSYLSLLLKAEVQNIKEEYSLINAKLDNERENINLLKAELVHLQSPQRLKRLATQYLKLRATTTTQLVTDPTKTDYVSYSAQPSFKSVSRIAWRYKKSPTQQNKQVHRASHNIGN